MLEEAEAAEEDVTKTTVKSFLADNGLTFTKKVSQRDTLLIALCAWIRSIDGLDNGEIYACKKRAKKLLDISKNTTIKKLAQKFQDWYKTDIPDCPNFENLTPRNK